MFPPKVPVHVYVCCADVVEDPDTNQVIAHMHDAMPATVTISPWCMPLEELFRRAIGRDQVMRESPTAGTRRAAWLCDSDYLFMEGALDALACIYQEPDPPALCFPMHYNINIDHRAGDQIIDRWPKRLKFRDSDFIRTSPGKAIGGLQIVRGDIALQGYCRETRRMRPAEVAAGFASCKCDVTYRRLQARRGNRFLPVDVPGVYRLRHSTAGRNYRYKPKGESA